VPAWCKKRKSENVKPKMAPGENFGGDKLTSRVMGIPLCEKLSHIHGWTYEPFGEPQENECAILPRIPLISSGDQAGAFFVLSVALSHSLSIYVVVGAGSSHRRT
jgi:hypothetical protein